MNIAFKMETFLKSGLSSDEFFILMLLEQKGFKSTEIAETLRLSDRTIYRYIKSLKEKGFIERVGLKYELTDKIIEII